jgi:HK97 family phage major capsid protein
MAEEVTMKDLQDELGKLDTLFKEAVERAEEAKGDSKAELAQHKEEIDKISDAMTTVEEKMAAFQARLDAPGGGGTDTDAEEKEHSRLLKEYMRKGDGMSPEDLKALCDWQKPLVEKGLTENVSATAGFLVRDETSNEIIKGVNETSPIRTIARVMQIGSMALEIPKRTGQFSATWVSETGARDETTGYQIGIERIPVHELHARVDLTNALLEDSFVNLESELGMEFIEQFALAEGTAHVTGDGVGKPEGFTVNAATLAAAITSGTNDAIEADDFINLLYGNSAVAGSGLKEPYHANATWVMNRTTLSAARKLKDGMGQYIWQPGLAAGVPNMILDRPYILATDMPQITDGAEALAIGDFRRGYMIVDRIGIQIKRIEDVSTISAGGVAIFARRRTGGQVVLAEAIKLLTIQ